MMHWKTVLLYGVALAAGTLMLQSLDFIAVTRAHSGDVVIGIVAFAFLALGMFVGMRLFAAPSRSIPAGNPAAQAALGISGRELDVLRELAAGRSNKEIATSGLGLSPNTVKTHVARLFAKLEARRRTEAIAEGARAGNCPLIFAPFPPNHPYGRLSAALCRGHAGSANRGLTCCAPS